MISAALEHARLCPGPVVAVFQDEASFYRQPGQGWLWAWAGRQQPHLLLASYPDALMIYVIPDNWPVPLHKKVRAFLGEHPRLQILRLPHLRTAVERRREAVEVGAAELQPCRTTWPDTAAS